MDIKQVTKELVSFWGISGFEKEFSEYVCEKLKKYCADAKVMQNRSVVGTIKCEKEDAPTVLIDAHLDRIGLIVSSVDENGFVGFDTVGGVDERILPAAEVWILGKEKVFGIIGAKPPHITSKDDEKQGLKAEDMLIDTGLGGDAKELISVGDPILLDSRFCELLNGRISSGALDNRISMAAVFCLLDALKDKELNANLVVAFTGGEEQGLFGAYTLDIEKTPDLAVVLDVTYGRTPDAAGSDTFELGSGAAVCRGPNVHYEMTKKVIEIAKRKNIPYEIEVASGSTGTNAWAFQVSAHGIPCVVISIPLRYMHTSVETVDLRDVESVSALVEEIICGGEVIA